MAPSHVVPPLGGRERTSLPHANSSSSDRLKPGLHTPIANLKSRIFPLLTLLTLLTSLPVHAQWLTQSFDLKGGWNAIYLHVDASHATLSDLIGSDPNHPIQEVWLWVPSASQAQFITSPQQPVDGGTQWIVWSRSQGSSSALQRLAGNVACLVRVSSATSSFTWNLKGKPVPPQYQWTTTGLNFLGFPTPAANPPNFEDFLAKAPSLAQAAEVYQYPGGELGANNPVRVFSLRTTPVRRGEAFWMRTGTTFNRYFGPFDLHLQNSSGVHFRDTLGQYRIRLRNATSGQITVTLNVLASETPPAGQTAIVQPPPLLLRGALDTANLTYGSTSLNAGPQSWVLAAQGQPGSEVEVILGVNRSVLTGNAADLHAGILRLTDSLGFSQIDLPVSASPASTSGLWVGNALVNQVRHYLKNYQRDTNNQPAFVPIDTKPADTTGLLLEMRLNEGSGGTVINTAPGATLSQGTLVNNPVWLAKPSGPPTDQQSAALEFNSLGQQYVDLGTGVVLGNAFTEEAWIYATGPGVKRGILGFEENPTRRSPSMYILANLGVLFSYTPISGAIIEVPLSPLFAPATWNHVATTYDGSLIRVYVNGVLRNQVVAPPPFSAPPIPVKWIGRVDQVFQGDNFFQGRIAQVRLWNVARTQAQIQSAMNRSQLTPILGTLSNYLVTSTNTSLGTVARPFNLRLIVHKSATETRLLQRVYYGPGLATNTVVSTRENFLHPSLLSSARRISAVHLPFSDGNAGWAFTGQFAQGQVLTNQINLDFGDYASNPFLHGFHPDHDNLNATFDATEPRGVESYDSERKVTLTFTAPGNDFASLVSGSSQMTGQYAEEIVLKGRGTESRQIDTAGVFVLKRISDIAVLTTQ
ncbi:MAG: LamG domain-containing protein [Verrucomicrobia bacterium]|nr:LamG domain-containing protein [Verrucomicrobiota bacterium]